MCYIFTCRIRALGRARLRTRATCKGLGPSVPGRSSQAGSTHTPVCARLLYARELAPTSPCNPFYASSPIQRSLKIFTNATFYRLIYTKTLFTPVYSKGINFYANNFKLMESTNICYKAQSVLIQTKKRKSRNNRK